jgi:hypothetical protein
MRDLSLAIWALCAALLVACEVLGRVWRDRFAPASSFLGSLSGTRVRALALFVGWMWLGWHFFAR